MYSSESDLRTAHHAKSVRTLNRLFRWGARHAHRRNVTSCLIHYPQELRSFRLFSGNKVHCQLPDEDEETSGLSSVDLTTRQETVQERLAEQSCALHHVGEQAYELCPGRSVRKIARKLGERSVVFAHLDSARTRMRSNRDASWVFEQEFVEHASQRRSIVRYMCPPLGAGSESVNQATQLLAVEDTPARPLVLNVSMADESVCSQLWGPVALLQHLQGECALHQRPWWTYQFCVGKHLVQYHEQNQKRLQEYSLGEFSAQQGSRIRWSDAQERSVAQGSRPYRLLSAIDGEWRDTPVLVQWYVNGTECDMTGMRRETEVEFRCQPGAKLRILRLEEYATCRYRIVVAAGALCHHPVMMPKVETEDTVPIACAFETTATN